MLYKSTSKNQDILLYQNLKDLWDNTPTHRGREILSMLDIDRTHLWRLLNKKVGDTPMRKSYLIILEQELVEKNTIEDIS